MEITRGKIPGTQKVCVYGPEGIGKTTFASQFPNPVFIDTEGSTKYLDVSRTPKPSSWAMVLEQVRYLKESHEGYRTLVIDTLDWAEQLCIAEVCAKAQKKGIEDFGYGKGYVYLAEEFGKLLNLLGDVVKSGMHVVLTAHAAIKKFEQPDELGAYDRWELKLGKKTAPLVKEWTDFLLFANYKTVAVAIDNEGKKYKGRGGRRVMHTSHHSCWDAKNRVGMPDETDFDYKELAPWIQSNMPGQQAPVPETSTAAAEPGALPTAGSPADSPVMTPPTTDAASAALTALQDLMAENQVLDHEIQTVVAAKGYYPEDTPIANYDTNFISGVLVGAWQQVLPMILEKRPLPF